MNRRVGLTLSLVGILALALTLRLWGVGFGFPHAYHFDEPAYVRIALDLGAGIVGRQPNPTGFSNILFGEYVVYFILGRMSGLFASAAEIERAWQADPSAFFILFGRLTSVALGALGVLTAYWLGRETSSRAAGLLAALFLAVAFLHVRDSHYAMPDIPAATLTSLAVLFSILAIRRQKHRYLCLAAAAAGYSIAIKWSVLPVIVPLVVAALHRLWLADSPIGRSSAGRWPSVAGHWSLTGGLFIAGFLAGGLQLVLKPALYFNYVLYEWEAGKAGGFWFWRVDTVSGWIFYLKTLNYGLGTVLLALALAGFVRRLVLSICARDRMSILLLSFPLLYFPFMGSTHHYFARYALPLVPFCALFGADTVMAVSTWVGTRRARWEWGLAAGLAILATAQPLCCSIRHGVILTRQDTRTLAKQWIEAHIPAGAKVAMDWPVYGPPLSSEVYKVKNVGGAGLADHPIAWYQEKGFDYLVASSFIYDIPLVYQDQEARRQAFYAALDEELELVQEFHPGEGRGELPFIFDEIYGPAISLWHRTRPGPVLRIYRLK